MEQHDEKKIAELLEKKDAHDQKAIDVSSLSKQEKELYESIRSMDDLMSQESLRTTSSIFSKRLMNSLNSAPLHTSGKKMLFLLFWILGLVLISSAVVVMFVNSGSPISSGQLAALLSQINGMVSVLGSPKLQQFLMAVEGIVVLVIIEKIISSQRMIRKSA